MSKTTVKYVAVNERGYRIGGSHHNSTLSDELVDQIRDMREDENMTYEAIAQQLKLSKELVAKICRYERRAQTPDRWKKVIIHE